MAAKPFNPAKARPRKTTKKTERYLITYAQNATPVHEGFLATLLLYAKERDAQLLIIPGRYHNPTSHWGKAARSQDYWDDRIHEYLFAGKHQIGPNLSVHGDISIQPTATRPLSGFEVYAGQSSAIFGHPKIQLGTVPTDKRRWPRIFTTSGSLTLRNYIPGKAGKKAHAHHVFGATVVERAGDLFHLRQINAEPDGSFIDLDRRFTPSRSMKAPRAAGLICGDVHVAKSDQAVLDATLYGEDSIANVLRPEQIVYHDVLDFRSRNHHRIRDPFERWKKHQGLDVDSVEDEVRQACDFIDQTPRYAKPVVVSSNHDEAFDRWLRESDPKQDPENAVIYHRMWVELLETCSTRGDYLPALYLYYRMSDRTRAHFVQRDESYKIKGISCGDHGDDGINGARGSALTYAKLGVKVVRGHDHSPSILDGCYTVGITGDLDQGYNRGPSGWLNSHCVVYNNGKRSLVHVIHNDQGGADWRG